MKAVTFLTTLRWLWRFIIIWITLAIERALGVPVFSLILLSFYTQQASGWRRISLIVLGSCILAALYMWTVPLALVLAWSLYFWNQAGSSLIDSQNLRLFLGGWLGGVVVAWLNVGWDQPHQLIYFGVATVLSLMWLKRKQAWQLKLKK